MKIQNKIKGTKKKNISEKKGNKKKKKKKKKTKLLKDAPVSVYLLNTTSSEWNVPSCLFCFHCSFSFVELLGF